MRLNEKFLPLSVAALLAASRLLEIFSLKYDSDELQHMHTVWSWANGLVQYRDLFDNHTPLFHMLLAPFIALFGATPHLLLYGRLLMLPLFAADLYFVYLAAETVFDRETALWTSLAAGFALNFSGASVEFRPDNLWLALFAASTYLLLKKENTLRSGAGFGLLTAANSLVSLKTLVFLLPAAALAWFFSWLCSGKPRGGFLRFAAGAALAAALVWLVFLSLFYELGALKAMFYGTLLHNLLPSVYTDPGRKAGVAALWLLAGFLPARRLKAAAGPLRLLWFLAFSLLAVSVLYPVLERETRLPVTQTAAVLAGGLLFSGLKKKAPDGSVRVVILAGALVFFVFLVRRHSDRAQNLAEERLWSDILRLTDPDDYVMDAKGENIFRRRPYYYALELFTKRRMQAGLLDPERIGADMSRQKDWVLVTLDKEAFPASLTAIGEKDFLEVSPFIEVAGARLRPAPGRGATAAFDVLVEGGYSFLPAAAGRKLDGRPLVPGADVYLLPGRHRFDFGNRADAVCAVFSKAVERGFIPAGCRSVAGQLRDYKNVIRR